MQLRVRLALPQVAVRELSGELFVLGFVLVLGLGRGSVICPKGLYP